MRSGRSILVRQARLTVARAWVRDGGREDGDAMWLMAVA
jgi:hypothetical protein